MKKIFQWPTDEKIIYIRPPKEQYNGSLSDFYDAALFPELKILSENWKRIRDEIFKFEKENGSIRQVDTFSPAEIEGNYWSTIFLRNYMWKFYHNMKKFPITSTIIEKIPNCTFATISVLDPKTSIKPHYGDTNGIIRVHLGLSIPGKYPLLGIKVGEEENCWEDGKMLCYPDIKKHEVWNKTEQPRYILILDIVPQAIGDKKIEICRKTLGSQSFIFFYKRFALIRKLPEPLQNLIVFLFSIFWGVYLLLQNFFDVIIKKFIYT